MKRLLAIFFLLLLVWGQANAFFISSNYVGGSAGSGAVAYDGNTFLERAGDLTGSTDTNKWTFAVWLKTTTASRFIYVSDGTFVTVTINGSGNLEIGGLRSSGATIVSYTTAATVTSGSWTHIVFSFDLSSTSRRHVYVNGSADAGTWATYSNDNIDFTRPNHFIGGNGGVTNYVGDMYQFFSAPGSYVDLSNSTNLQKFYNSGVVDYGSTGQTPLGSTPMVFLNSPNAADWKTNLGTGGGFGYFAGTLTAASTKP